MQRRDWWVRGDGDPSSKERLCVVIVVRCPLSLSWLAPSCFFLLSHVTYLGAADFVWAPNAYIHITYMHTYAYLTQPSNVSREMFAQRLAERLCVM